MSQATAIAHANLAFIKYWGKKDPELNLPLNNSISMNLSAAQTVTTVEFDSSFSADTVILDGQPAAEPFAARVRKHLDLLRWFATKFIYAHVETHNNFPVSAGFASSASGFAALTVAALKALDIGLGERDISILARRGSGSACRSIPAGFVEWYAGTASNNSYAAQLAPPDHWDIVDVAVVVTDYAKDISSSKGHLLAPQSPFWQTRTEQLPNRLDAVRQAIVERDFHTFGRATEAEAISMHAIMMTSAHTTEGGVWRSGIYYWSPATLELITAVQRWRAEGIPVYFTLDAGPTVHLLCPAASENQVADAVMTIRKDRGWTLFISHPAPGAHTLA